MKLYEVKGVGKLQGMTVMSLDAFVKGAKLEKEMDESDISGLLHAARNYNKSFLITADCDDGKRRTYRVRAQSERVAREKFLVHHAMAKIVSVKEEGVAEGGPFSYGYKKPRKGSVAYYADLARKEQEKNYKPIEPKDQMVGTAKVKLDDYAGSEDEEKRMSESAEEMTPNWAKYVLDQIYNSNGAVTMTDLFDEGIPGLHDMFVTTAQEHGLDPEEEFEEVQEEVLKQLEDIIRGGHGLEESENAYGYKVGQTVKLDNGQQGRVIDIFNDSIEVLLPVGRTVTVDFRDAQVIGESVNQKVKEHHFIYEGIWDHIKNVFKTKPKYVRPTRNTGESESDFQRRVTDAWNEYKRAIGEPTEQPSYAQKPEPSGSDKMGHGSEDNELKMFMAGEKPAAIISPAQLSKWQKLIDSGKYATAQLMHQGRPAGVIIAQPGEEHRVEKIQSLVQNATDAADNGDFRAYQNSNYHRWLGKLLGYSEDKINSFIQNYFKDTPDLAKKPVYEGKARLPQPEDFDSDWDYQEALDAYERSHSGNDDYDYENMIDEADTENPDRITIASQGKGYIVYHSFNRDAYTARGVGEWKGQIEPEWFYSLADAEDHAEMEIAGHDEHYGKIDELTFKGSTCTKDCSGHEAGYNWYQRKGRVPNSHSKSFNKGADIASNESVNEAPGDFGLGANYRDIPDDEMQAFLDRTKNKEKTKRDKYDYPYVHASSIQIKNEEGREYDLDSLRKEIMTRPAHILGQNAKMQHSETGTEAIFDIGLPALKGLAVNEKTGQFVVVDTCPGAGACKTYCYAMKGSYVMFKAVSMGLARMLNFLLNDPEGFKNKLNAEIAAARSKMAKKGARVVVRWHDAGDFFSPEYLGMAYGVARDNPDVGFYAYTKIADVATGDRPKNFNMNFSQGALSGQEKKVDFKRVKHSKVVPKDMFFDLVARKGLNLIKDAKGRMQFASPENLEDFKTRMAKHYAIDKDSILTYDQMMDTPVGNAPKWNVIVMPGDGDNSANRNDVIGSYLLFH